MRTTIAPKPLGANTPHEVLPSRLVVLSGAYGLVKATSIELVPNVIKINNGSFTILFRPHRAEMREICSPTELLPFANQDDSCF